MKNMMEGIKSYKEILLSGKQKFFLIEIKLFKEQALRYNLKFTIIELIPKHLIELIFVISLLGSTYYFVEFEKINLIDYLPFIGVMVLGLLKFLPNLLRIFSSHQQFKYLLPIIDIINENLSQINKNRAYELEKDSSDKIVLNKNIELRNVSFRYSEKNIINNLNLKIKKILFQVLKVKVEPENQLF